MVGQYEEPALFSETPAQQQHEQSTSDGSQKSTQTDRVLSKLVQQGETCGSEFYADFIPRFSVSIHKLRRAGYVIQKRQCDRIDHAHEGTGWLYKLEAMPVERLR